MKSLFDSAGSKEVIERINRLTPDTKPEWGKMNASQVMAHMSQALLTSTGELKLKRGLIGALLGSMVKKKITGSDEPFKKGLPTDKSFIISDERNFEEEKAKLISIIQRFTNGGPEGVTKEMHPFFGKMTPGEWDIVMMKHVDHHLRQFRV